MQKIVFDSKEIKERYRFLEKYNITEKYYDILNHLEHEVQIIDREYNIVFANDKSLCKYGDEIVGKICYKAMPYEERDKPCEHCPCLEVLEKGKLVSHMEYIEFREKNRQKCYINETATPLCDENAIPVLAVKIGRDITKRVLLEQIKTNIQVRVEHESPKGERIKFSEHIKFIVNELHKVGYHRIRFYDVIKDTLKGDQLCVLRASVNMDNRHEKSYRFYLGDKRYYPSPRYALKPRIWDADEVLANNPENIVIAELGLKGHRWLQLPLIVEGNLVGLIAIDNVGTDTKITNEDLSLLGNFATYLAQAILAIRADMNLGILDHINRVINQRRPGREILDSIAEEVCTQMQAGACQIFLYSTKSHQLVRDASYINIENIPQNGEDLFPEQYNPGQNVTGKVFIARKPQPLNLLDIPGLKSIVEYEKEVGQVNWEYVRKYEDFIAKHTDKHCKIKNAIFVPLVFEEETIGVIRVVNNLVDGRFPFPNTDLDLLVKIATEIAAVVQNERIRDQVDTAILKIASSLSAREFDVPEVAQEIVKTVQGISGASAVSLFLKDEDKKLLESIAKTGFAEKVPEEELTYNLDINTKKEHWAKGIGLAVFVAITGESFTAASRREIVKQDTFAGKFESFLHPQGQHTESLLIEPLRQNGDVIGVLRAEDPSRNKFSRTFQRTFKLMAQFAALALASAQEIKRKEDLFISLGHELGIPATALVALAEVMQRRYQDGLDVIKVHGDAIEVPSKMLLKYCEYLKAEAIHLRFLTSGRAALDAGAQYQFEEHSLRWSINEVVTILRNTAKWYHIDINYEPKNAPSANIRMDKEKLKQAFYNVIQNAIKYSPKNSVIDIDITEKGNSLVVKIKDNGIGVDEGDIAIIFRKDRRGKNAIGVDPTSLGRGLYHTKMVIDEHEGKIELTNRRMPTIFTITLKR